MNKLTIKGGFAMIIVLPVMFTISLTLIVMAYIIKLFLWLFKFVGIIDAMDYLSYQVKRKQKLNSFFNTLSDDDKKTWAN